MLGINHLSGFSGGTRETPVLISSDKRAIYGTDTAWNPSLSVAAGDLLVIASFVTSTSSDVLDPVSGWTNRVNTTIYSRRLMIDTCAYTGSETIQRSFTSGVAHCSVAMSYRNAAWDTIGTLASSLVASAITTGGADSIVSGLFGSIFNGNFSADISPPSGFTERQDAKDQTGSLGGTWFSLELCDKTFSAAGSTGAQTATCSPTPDNAFGVLISVKPLS
jgi:hypothetical protein